LVAPLAVVVVRLVEAGCGGGFAVMLLLGLPLALLVPLGTLNNDVQPRLNPTTLGSMLLSLWSTLVASSLVTIIIAGPPVDLP
jgi:ABC-type antimicrobial peptide transport system permease subunit